ncbi:MAG TPA: hypothetical protein VFY43_07240 [Candidatus Limnocylindria bacterium]|nr:hypothetical protein [Candidatus Limnocylindria bacterium]
MDDTARAALAAAARRQGRELAALAYLVLQNRAASEGAAAAGLADVLRIGPAPAWPATVGAVLRRGLEAHRSVHEVDAPGDATPPALTGLTPLRRAIAGGHLLASVPLEELATPLGLPLERLRRELAAAEHIGGSRDALRQALEAVVAGRAFAVTAEAVEAAMAFPPPGPIRRSRRPLWLGGAAIAALVLAGALAAAAQPSATSVPPSTRTPAAAAGPPGYPPGGLQGAGAWAGDPALPRDDRLTLADCDIQPAGTPLAFRGWLTLGDLAAGGHDVPGGGTPVYTLVTDGRAEWVGWQTTEGRPMFPRPIGRMACAVDPLTGAATVFSVADGWKPPAPMDDCPASPIFRYAGDHQVGGPNAYFLLPYDGEAWWSRTQIVIRVRIAPSPQPGSRITATAQRLDGSPVISLPVDSAPIPDSRQPTSNHYLWLRPVTFPRAGCWLVTVSVDGQAVGAAILPITAPSG